MKSLIDKSNLSKNFYDIDKIITRKIRNGKKMYLIKWEGYSLEYCSWESISHLKNVLNIVKEFELNFPNSIQREDYKTFLRLYKSYKNKKKSNKNRIRKNYKNIKTVLNNNKIRINLEDLNKDIKAKDNTLEAKNKLGETITININLNDSDKEKEKIEINKTIEIYDSQTNDCDNNNIPYKYEVIGKTVGATNYHIKSLLTKEPDYSQTYIPSINKDYTYYKKDYFNEDFAKGYELEEDKIYGMRSKEARTWIDGNKHQLYPEHVPGYTGHLTGIEPAGKKGCPIFGTSYSKASAISIKGNFNKEIDLPPEERYLSMQKKCFVVPQMRSKDDMGVLSRENELIEEARNAKEYFDKLKVRRPGQETVKINLELSEGFKNAINRKKSAPKLPYIVGYKGFRPGVVANNYYGKNFREISLVTSNPD